MSRIARLMLPPLLVGAAVAHADVVVLYERTMPAPRPDVELRHVRNGEVRQTPVRRVWEENGRYFVEVPNGRGVTRFELPEAFVTEFLDARERVRESALARVQTRDGGVANGEVVRLSLSVEGPRPRLLAFVRYPTISLGRSSADAQEVPWARLLPPFSTPSEPAPPLTGQRWLLPLGYEGRPAPVTVLTTFLDHRGERWARVTDPRLLERGGRVSTIAVPLSALRRAASTEEYERLVAASSPGRFFRDAGVWETPQVYDATGGTVEARASSLRRAIYAGQTSPGGIWGACAAMLGALGLR